MKHCSQCQLLFADHVQLCPEDGAALRLVEDIGPGMVVRHKYRIVSRIGAGGMATVFRARHEMLNEDRAIKLVLPKYANDKDFLKRFRNEAAVARRLRHENAVWVEDLDQIEDGRPFIAMEFLQGRDLRTLIEKEGPLSVQRSLALASQVASALSAAHELGIIHRDIKPDNIFITQNKQGQEIAKVLDFGIAKALEGTFDGGYTATATGLIVGTPQYISPEQAMGQAGKKVDGRADIYSLGIVIYEMLTARLPFESETPMGMVLHHLNTTPQPPHQLHPELHIPQPVSLLLMKALEKEPSRRFQTAREMMEALQRPAAWATVTFPPVREASAAPTRIVASAALAASAAPAPAPAPVAAVAINKEGTPVRRVEEPKPGPSLRPEPAHRKPNRWLPWLALPAVVVLALGVFLLLSLQHPSDSHMQDLVVQQLQASPSESLHSGSIKAQVHEGVVTLDGAVASDDEKNSAADLARSVAGVREVVNKILVRATARPGENHQPTLTQNSSPPQTAPGSQRSTSTANSPPAPSSTPGRISQTSASQSSGSHPAQETPVVIPIQGGADSSASSVRAAALRKMLDQANKERDNGNYKQAVNAYNEVLKLDPNNNEAKAGLVKAQQAAEWEISH